MKEKIPTILFNLFELAVILMFGYYINDSMEQVALLIAVYLVAKVILGRGKHYKNPILCLFWSTLLFVELFVILELNVVVAFACAIFCTFIISDHADIKDLFMWSNHNKHSHLIAALRNADDKKIREYEEYLSKNFNTRYLVFQKKFKEEMNEVEIRTQLGLSEQDLGYEIDTIAIALEYILHDNKIDK